MQEASFNGLLRAVLYMLAFYYAFKFLARLFLPMLVKKVVDKAGENFQQQQARQTYGRSADQTFYDTQSQKTDAAATNRTSQTKKVGEYIDYEEID